MKRNGTRIFSACAAFALLLGLSACSKPGNGPQVSSDISVSSDASAPSLSTESTAPGGDVSSESTPDTPVGTTTAGNKPGTNKPNTKTTATPPKGITNTDSIPSKPPKYPTFTNEAGTVMAKIDTVKGKTITLLCVDYGQFEPEGPANVYLKKYYGITVKQTKMPNDNIASEFTTAYLSGTPYDLVTDTQVFPQFVTQNVIEPLTNRVDFSSPEMAKNKGIYDSYVYSGHNFFLPWVSSRMAYIYFNKEVFEDANLDLDGDGKKGDDPYTLFQKGKWTWETFKTAAKQTNRTNKNGEILTYGLLARNWTDSKLVYISGQTLTKQSGGKPVSNLGNSDYQRIYNDYVALINNDKVARRGDDSIYNTFNNGGGAMLLGPSYMTTGKYFPTIFSKQNVGIAPIPKDNKSGSYLVPGECYGFWVSKGGFYRDGKFDTDLLNAFINGALAAEVDRSKKGGSVYNTLRDEFVKEWSAKNKRFTNSWYDNYTDLQKGLTDATTPVIDPYSECLNLNQVLDTMTGWGDQPPKTFSAAVNEFEGQLKQQLDALLSH